MPPCDKVILSFFFIWVFTLDNIFANERTCTLVLNEEGDFEQIEMKSNNFTGLSNKGTIVSLSREPCVNNSTIHLTILPEDIKVLTFSKKSQAKLTLNIRYTLAFFRNSSRLQTLQRSVLLTRSREFKQLTCWLPISVLDHLHVAINVTVAGEEYNTVVSSTLDAMDQAITCKEGCKSDDIMFNTSYLCSKNGTFNHKQSARVLRVSFTPLDKGQTTLKHWSVVSYRQLNADLYCYVYSDIRIVCDHVTSKSDPYDETESFGMFVIFGLIVMTCLTAILALIIFVVQKLMGLHRAYKNRRESTPKERRRLSSLLCHLKTDEVIRNSILNMHKIVSEPEAQPLRGHGNGTSSERETSFLRNSIHKSSHNRIARRFVSRRSLPRMMISDNATTYQAATNQIRGHLNVYKQQLYSKGHSGSSSQNEHLGMEDGGSVSIAFQMLQTVVTEVEAMINDRPLKYVSSSRDDPEPRTPSHLLHGRRLPSLPFANTEVNNTVFNCDRDDVTSRSKRHAHLLDHYWRR
ncbi:uncharacterized protein LOC128241032 [Mya arenaria]|uniref:uncharacterized protein LOC128241032 n=1 Tax=Mya arenaria TaxID=6604 RepID=UPI0022E84791|nr:uncharacterized protein LOC128241032 [Mya arenaria]